MRVLIAEDTSYKVDLIKRLLPSLLLENGINESIEWVVVASIKDYKEMDSPFDFDMAFVDQYLEIEDAREGRLRDAAYANGRRIPISYLGAFIVSRLSIENPKISDLIFNISADGFMGVPDSNVIRNIGVEFDEKVGNRIPQLKENLSSELNLR